jgi:DnaK suppressor protein
MNSVGALLRTRPTAEQLQEAQLSRLRAVLEREREFRREQLAELAASRQPACPAANRSRYLNESQVLHEIAQTLALGARQALESIDRALHHMEAGDYGFCATCGQRIPLPLLWAVPQTTICQNCRPPSAITTRAAAEP